MIDPFLKRFHNVWMIGINGSGMCGIAEVLTAQGFKVSGSDMNESEVAERLRSIGVDVRIGHKAEWVKGNDVVIYSSAVRENNVELQAAIANKIPIVRRAEMLAELMRMKTGIAISGSHGKTSITSLTGEIVAAGGLDPTVIVGGRLNKLSSGVVSGKGEILIAEADEYDQSFLRLSPVIVLVNNIDNDHLECYGGYEQLEAAFVQFANSVPFYGRTIVNLDEPSIHPILPRLNRTVVTYGFTPQADVKAEKVEYRGMQSIFEVVIDGEKKGTIDLPLPGKFNVHNTLGGIAIGNELGIPFKKIKQALENFSGVHRRFEILGEVGGRMVVTDFGHHPTAISVTLEAAKAGWNRRVIAIFQAHLYSRTQMLAEQFGQALLKADKAIVLPIYPAREDPIEGVTGRLIYDAARDFGHKDVAYLEDRSKIVDLIKNVSEPNDMILVIGAGNVHLLAPDIIEGLKEICPDS